MGYIGAEPLWSRWILSPVDFVMFCPPAGIYWNPIVADRAQHHPSSVHYFVAFIFETMSCGEGKLDESLVCDGHSACEFICCFSVLVPDAIWLCFFYKFIIVKIFGQVQDFLVSKEKWYPTKRYPTKRFPRGGHTFSWGTTFHRMWIHGIQILCFGCFLGFSRQVKSSRAPRLGWMEFLMGPILNKLLLVVKGWQTSLIFRNSSHNSSKIKSRVPTCLPNHFLGCQPQIDAKIIIGA